MLRRFSKAQPFYAWMIMGKPGVGKGTYAKLISKDFKIPTISMGDELRKLTKTPTPGMEKITATIKAGKLIDDLTAFNILQARLKQPDCKTGYLLDGFPRNVPQAQILEKNGVKIQFVINVTIEDDVIVEKLLGRRVCKDCGANFNVASIFRGDIEMPPLNPKVPGICDDCGGKLVERDDDTKETITNRLKVYDQSTHALLEFYKSKLINFRAPKGKASYPELLKTIKQSIQ